MEWRKARRWDWKDDVAEAATATTEAPPHSSAVPAPFAALSGSKARVSGSVPPPPPPRVPRDHGPLHVGRHFPQPHAVRPGWCAALSPAPVAVNHRQVIKNPTVQQQQALFVGASDAVEEKIHLYNCMPECNSHGRHRQYYDHGLHDYINISGSRSITRGQNRSSRSPRSDSMICARSSDELVRMIMCCTSDKLFKILRGTIEPWIHPSTIRGLVMDANRVRVVRAFVQRFPSYCTKFIFNAVAENCTTIACYSNGLCLLQDCLMNANRMEKDHIFTKVSYSSFGLAQDPYGNYIVQYVLKERDPSHLAIISSCFINHYVELSRQKYSSNVVETCLKNFSDIERTIIINELLLYPYFEDLVTDEFANYVISTALQICKASLQQILATTILSFGNINRRHPHCLKIFRILSKYGYINEYRD